jgi:Mrp family chromosome partitioning ATPase
MPFVEVPEAPSTSAAAISSTASIVHRNGNDEKTVVRFVDAAPWHPLPPSKVAAELIIWHEPASPAASHYRNVASALRPLLASENARSLLLLPVEPLSDHVIAVLNLALAVAEKRERTLLIDACPDGRGLAERLGIAAAPGWTDVLYGLPPKQAIQDTGWHRLHLLAAGNRLAGASSPLLGERMRGVMEEMHAHYDLVLLQTARCSAGGASAVFPYLCDAVCLILDKRQVGQPAENHCLEALRAERIRVIGSVVVAS